MHTIRQENAGDESEIRRLLGSAFDATHSKRNIWALREGAPVDGLCLVAPAGAPAGVRTGVPGDVALPGVAPGARTDSSPDTSEPPALLGSIRYWPITVAGLPSLLLGPLAVSPEMRGQGIGQALVSDSLNLARKDGHWRCCFVSGEPHYYLKFGFEKLTQSDVILPQAIEEERLHLLDFSSPNLKEMPPRPWVISAREMD